MTTSTPPPIYGTKSGLQVRSRAHIAVGKQRDKNPLAIIYSKLLLHLLPLVAVAIAVSPQSERSISWFNTLGPVYFVVVMTYAAYAVARHVPAAIWSPAFWLVIAAAFFFGFGPLVEIFGNAESQLRLSDSSIAISKTELFKSHQLSFVSLFALILGFWVHTQVRIVAWLFAFRARQIGRFSSIRPETLILFFIFGGMIFMHLIAQPAQWGQLNIVIPGAINSISAMADIGFALAIYLGLRGSRRMLLVFALVWPLHFFLTCLSFAKLPIILSLLLPVIGAYAANRRTLWLVFSFLAIIGIYIPSQSYVAFGRSEIFAKSGTIYLASYEERLQLAGEYFTSDRISKQLPITAEPAEEWWLRLNYSNVQALGMRYRDRGVHIDSLSGVWMMFVPRFIWPSKPIYVGPGQEFYELVTGRVGTFLGISVMGDVYWQFGWVGIVLIMPAIGWLFAILARRSILAIEQQNYVEMPLVLLSILIATNGLTKWLANGIIAVIPIYVGYLLLIRIVEWHLHAKAGHVNHRARQNRPSTANDGQKGP